VDDTPLYMMSKEWMHTVIEPMLATRNLQDMPPTSTWLSTIVPSAMLMEIGPTMFASEAKEIPLCHGRDSKEEEFPTNLSYDALFAWLEAMPTRPREHMMGVHILLWVEHLTMPFKHALASSTLKHIGVHFVN